MALGIQDLMAAAQRAGIDPGQAMQALGGGAPQAAGGAPGGGMPPGGGGGGDLGSQLMGLVGKVASSPGGAQLMQQAIGALMGGGGSPGQDPRAAMAAAPAPTSALQNLGQNGVGPGPSTDMELMNMARANQGVRGNLPIQYKGDDYTGFTNEVRPMPDPRQTPQGMTTEQELEQARQGMGATKSGDPSADGNFPTPQAIKALEAGEISPKDFDAEWGKGAAKEIMGQSGNDGATDDGDHEYR